MSVSSEVDIGLLTDCFNLKPFNGLRRLLDDYESSEDKDEKEDVEETEEEGLCLQKIITGKRVLVMIGKGKGSIQGN